MGSIVKLKHPRPFLRHARTKAPAEQELLEARRSVFILTSSFLVAATVMCVAVVAIMSSTWTDVMIMSAFVLVFALLKIVLANTLIYTMLRYDAEHANVPLQAGAGASYRRLTSIRPASAAKGRPIGSLKISKLRIAHTAQPSAHGTDRIAD
jgi:hypothetical protein